MKLPTALLTLGLALITLGYARRDDPELPFALRQRLDGELSRLRSHGHAAQLLVTSGSATELTSQTRTRARETGETIIAVSPEWADWVPSAKDAELADASQWSALAPHVAWPYLRNNDVGGAATALVRAYSTNLIERGYYPAQPPLPPIFLPDVVPSKTRSIDVHATGLGIVLAIVGLALLLERRRASRATG